MDLLFHILCIPIGVIIGVGGVIIGHVINEKINDYKQNKEFKKFVVEDEKLKREREQANGVEFIINGVGVLSKDGTMDITIEPPEDGFFKTEFYNIDALDIKYKVWVGKKLSHYVKDKENENPIQN